MDTCIDSTAMQMSDVPVCQQKFEDLSYQKPPHIACMKPATDFCQSNIVKIICLINLPESQKLVNLKVAEKYLEQAKQEREDYNEQYILAARDWN